DIQLVDAETGDLSRFFIFIYKIENNPYNRPPSKYFVNQNYGFDINSAEMLDINGYPALLHYSDRHVSTSILINRTTYRVTLESRPGYSFPITKPYLSEYLTLLSSFTNPLPDTSQLNVIDGNIFIIEKNESIQLTDSGYDMEPLLSPDGNKIAYFSEAETIDMTCPDASDAGCGYDKVFDILVINSDGTNKVKLTESETLIEREILGWVDNNTVLYRDGNKSIKAYSVDSNSYQTIIGPDDAVTECFNGSCQNGYYYLWSEDHRYYVIFRGGVAAERAVYIVDTQTSEATDLEESLNFVKCYVPKLNNTTLTFTCDNTYPVPDGGLQMEPLRNVTDITYDLRTKEISEKPSWELN
ncbi:MAG: hypothetical protein QG639_486, partial [Patescibacteria group bacterium]|nr:hypothetical protein [Patescibacteria group bacterium]